jgi:hypothetical protein
MKKLLGSFIVFGCVLTFPLLNAHAQKSFEGTLTWTTSMPIMGDDDQHPMIINMKGQKSETEMEMGPMGTVRTYSDYGSRKIYAVTGTQKTGFVMDMSDTTIKNIAQKQLDSLDLKPTGKKETIAGHPAEEYLLTGIKMMGTSVQLSIWAASGFPKELQESLSHSLSNSPGQDPKQSKALRQLADKGLVPVRTVISKDGEVAMTMEFVKYEAKSLDDSIFVPPADVKFSAPPRQMGGGMN